ncbi:alcohol oxidase-like protein [Nemania abortiva]|nr:alcohol oxidase-like protein [Nemania abortiva]
MGLYTQLPAGVREVDVIVAGGGTAGCAVAGRLAQAAGLSILVIESGPSNLNDPTIVNPLMFVEHYRPGGGKTTFYMGRSEQQLAGRQLFEPVASVLGGGSSVNMMVYSRAKRADFDGWNVPGWSADEMLPYLNKLETYYGPDNKHAHGHAGPLQVTQGPFNVPRLEDDFVTAAGKVGYPEVSDIYDMDTGNGVQRAMRFIGPDGKRQDTAHRYLHPLLQGDKHPNLHVLVGTKVVRVLLDNHGKAVGVEYASNNGEAPSQTVKANKMVILSCGVLGTPAVLERSGIGNSDILSQAGVLSTIPTPGVGEGFNDHNMILYPYKSSLAPEETVDSVQAGRVTLKELMDANAKVMGWNAQDVHGKIRPTDTEVAHLSSNFQEAWKKDFSDPSKPVAVVAPIGGYPGDPAKLAPMQYLGITSFTVSPYSRGHVHITGPSLSDGLDIQSRLFTDPQGLDLEMQKWTYKRQREIARRMNVFRGELPLGHPPFAKGSKAALVGVEKTEGLDEPLPVDITDIEYTADDDAVLEQWLRENIGLAWHPLGTCKMAPREEMGVVDESLNVYGTKCLKVVDLSIVPGSVSGNTMHTAVAIGEKAADIVLQQLGRSG